MDNKALIVTLVVVFVGGLVFGSASFGGLTGGAIQNTATVSVSPRTVNAGNNVNIFINPGNGADCRVYLYRVNQFGNELRVNDFEYQRGSGRTCTQATTYSFNVPTSWQPSQYCARVFSSASAVGSGSYAQGCFNVI